MSVDDLIRDRLETLVEPLDDPGAVVAAIEGRQVSTDGRRTWPMLAAVAAVAAIAAVGGAIWLGGERDRQVVAGPDVTTAVDSNTERDEAAEGNPSADCDGVELPDLSVVMPDGFTGPFAGLGGGAEPGPTCARYWQGPGPGVHVTQLPGRSPFGLAIRDQDQLFRWGPIHEGFGMERRGDPAWNVAAYGLDEEAFDRLVQAIIADDRVEDALLSARLELPAGSVRAGSSLSGEIVVQNDTGKPVVFEACTGPYQVVLSGESVSQTANVPLCAMSFTLSPGESRWPVAIDANYSACTTHESTGTPDDHIGTLPRCGPTMSPPPLPPGSYTVSFRAPAGVPIPPLVTIEVTPITTDTGSTAGP